MTHEEGEKAIKLCFYKISTKHKGENNKGETVKKAMKEKTIYKMLISKYFCTNNYFNCK